MSKIAPPNGSGTQDAAGKAIADQCRHVLICFAESRKYHTCEVVRVGKRPRNGHYRNGPVGTLFGLFLFVLTTIVEFIAFQSSATRQACK